MKLKVIENAEIENKRVLVKVDWNVTLGKALEVIDDTRIRKTLPTIKLLLENKAKKIVLVSHIGKAEEKKSIKPVMEYAEKVAGLKIRLCETLEECEVASEQILMLENIRLWEGEDRNDAQFAQQLADLADLYVDEAFGEAHRETASNVGITQYLPSYAGLWFEKEIEAILKIREKPEHPYVVIMGGAKVDDKLELLKFLATLADTILVGGKLANEFQQRKIKLEGRAKVILPVEGSDLLDIGKETINVFTDVIKEAKTIVWNGPLGKVEDEQYRAGTEAIYKAFSENTEAYTLVGGGDTLSAIKEENHLERIDFVSTGGGAMLALLDKGILPAISVLESKT